MENGRGLIPSGMDAAAAAVVWSLRGLEKAIVIVLPRSGHVYLRIPKTSIAPETGALCSIPGRCCIPFCIPAEERCGLEKALL